LDGDLQFHSGSESRNTFRFHQNLPAAARIADASRFAMGYTETAEPGKCDAIPTRQTGLDSG
jgi:hypothetical protein